MSEGKRKYEPIYQRKYKTEINFKKITKMIDINVLLRF